MYIYTNTNHECSQIIATKSRNHKTKHYQKESTHFTWCKFKEITKTTNQIFEKVKHRRIQFKSEQTNEPNDLLQSITTV